MLTVEDIQQPQIMHAPSPGEMSVMKLLVRYGPAACDRNHDLLALEGLTVLSHRHQATGSTLGLDFPCHQRIQCSNQNR